jgi:carbonic anhydrase/acetyltransferase-like protein (isoleucine patch superfamily)
VHTEEGGPTVIGEHCAIAQGAVVHSSTLDDEVFIGARAVVTGGNRIGRGACVRAGAVLPESVDVDPGSIMDGVPARRVGQVADSDMGRARSLAATDRRLAADLKDI